MLVCEFALWSPARRRLYHAGPVWVLASICGKDLMDWAFEVGPVEVCSRIWDVSLGEGSHCRAQWAVCGSRGENVAGLAKKKSTLLKRRRGCPMRLQCCGGDVEVRCSRRIEEKEGFWLGRTGNWGYDASGVKLFDSCDIGFDPH